MLRLVAEDVESAAQRHPVRRLPRRVVATAIGLAIIAGAAVLAIPERSAGQAPRFVNDAFSDAPYHPGGPGIAPGGPGPLPFFFPELSSVAAASADDGWIV